MGVNITYTCDRCGYSQSKETEPLLMIEIAIASSYRPSRPHVLSNTKTQLWCRTCADLLGITPTPKEEPQPTPVTFEDTIRELIRDELENEK